MATAGVALGEAGVDDWPERGVWLFGTACARAWRTCGGGADLKRSPVWTRIRCVGGPLPAMSDA